MSHRLFLSPLIAIVGLVLCGACFAYADEPQDGPVEAPPVSRTRAEAGIVLSKETTFLLEPLTEDGYVDYVAALNQQYGRGVKPEENAAIVLWQIWQDEQAELYRVPLYKAWGLQPPKKEQVLYVSLPDAAKLSADSEELWNQQVAAMSAPWDARQLPGIAAWIKANEATLAKAHEAAARPKYYRPLISEDGRALLMAYYFPMSGVRESARLLSARAMMRLHEKQYHAAWADLMAIARLGRLVGRGPEGTDLLVGIAIEGIAYSGMKQYLQHAPLDVQHAVSCRKAVAELPPRASLAEKLQYYDRYCFLDLVLMCVRANEVEQLLEHLGCDKPQRQVIDVFATSDFSAALRWGNRHYDRLVALFQVEDYDRRLQSAQRLTEELTGNFDTLFQQIDVAPNKAQAAGESLAKLLLNEVQFPIAAFIPGGARLEQQDKLLATGFALAAWRAEQGRFPDELADLVPKYLQAVPRDVFNGNHLIYRPTENGYLLYSVGPNREDDGGKPLREEGGDVILKIER